MAGKPDRSKSDESRCETQAYDMHQSSSAIVQSNMSKSLTYGSAAMTGFMWKDYSCL